MKKINKMYLKTIHLTQNLKIYSHMQNLSIMKTDHLLRESQVDLMKERKRNLIYRYCEKLFNNLPEEVKNHRVYFENGKGFGERAFHAAWVYILEKYRPTVLLEIGVYKGQILSLWGLVLRHLYNDRIIEIFGITPLENLGDSASDYENIDYELEIRNNLEKFQIKDIKIINGLSTSIFIKKQFEDCSVDLVYVDGGHNLKTVINDFYFANRILKYEGILVLDDSSMLTSLSLFHKGFRGHLGPSIVFWLAKIYGYKLILPVGHLNFLIKKL